jgi:hypothetical protein
MKKKQQKKVWGYSSPSPKITADKKTQILEKITAIIKASPKLTKKVSRFDVKANRLYLYKLEEIFISKGAVYLGTLIDGKYAEFIYARITLNDPLCDNCTVDWQRHNNKWITLHGGTLTECLNYIEDDDGWF